MSGEEETDKLLQEHQALRRALPSAWNAFFARFGRLRPVQRMAIPHILAGKNVLVVAPTAGGKTEAVIAPLCERIVRGRLPGLSVLAIAPTRALVNDLYARLANPCEQMGVRLGRKTSDHAMSGDAKENLLITTPESTESLLTFRRNVLASVRAVAVDEIHLLAGSPRGDQLEIVLNRLETYLAHVQGSDFRGLQRVALSATLPDPERVIRGYLGSEAALIEASGSREIDSRIVVSARDDRTRAQAAVRAAEAFDDVRKVLVFVNSRRQVDTGANHFRSGRFAGVPVYGHHGSLSKAKREEVESRFKTDHRALCVATMTLEVGIDIGDVDLVICMDPPFSLSSFLQRIGRGCRRLQDKTRVVCVARDRAGELMFQAMIRQSQAGLPAGPAPPFRRSVLVQQVLAYLRQVGKHRRTLEQFEGAFLSCAVPPLDRPCLGLVLGDLVRGGLLDEQGGVFRPAAKGWDFIDSSRIYSNMQPTPPEVALVDADTGRPVAHVADLGSRQDGVRVAGVSYDVLPGDQRGELKVRRGGDHADSPRYRAKSLPYASDVGEALARLLGIDHGCIAVLPQGSGCIVMTWLGRLMNCAIVEGIQRQGLRANASAFAIKLPGTTQADVLTVLRRAIQEILASNPLGSIRVERMVDAGPYLPELSEELQLLCREDWLDARFLSDWITSLCAVNTVDPGSSLGRDILALSST